jgi:hypothetical protein
VGEQPARPAHPALDLVEEEEQAELVRHLAQSAQVLGLSGHNAALALDRFHQEGRGLRRDRRAQLVEVGEGDVVEAFEQGLEPLGVLLLPAGRNGRHGAAVEGVVAGDDPVAAGVCRLDTLSAKLAATSRSARRSWPGMRYRFEQCQSFPPCSVRAWMRWGWLWPSAVTPMPEAKSR